MLKHISLLLVLLIPNHAFSAMYKWVDDEGNTVYSQTPPPAGISASKMRPPPPPADPNAQKQLNQLKQRLEDAQEDRDLARSKRESHTREQDRRAENCRRAKANMQQIEQRSRQLEHDGKGHYQRLTPTQKAARIAEYQEVIAKDCRPRK